MRYHMIVLLFLLMAAVIGCTKEAPVYDEGAAQQVPDEESVTASQPETAEPAPQAPEDAPVSGEEQLEIADATDIEQEKETLISDVVCEFGPEGPVKFGFTLHNIEQKTWSFSTLSYSDRDKLDNMVVIVNAMQVTNTPLINACGGKTVFPGTDVVCNFDINSAENLVIKKNLRIGDTPLGNPNMNTVSAKTSSHAAEIKFLCE